MAWNIFPAGSLTATGKAETATVYDRASGGRQLADLWTVGVGSVPSEPFPSGRIPVTASGAYASFMVGDDSEPTAVWLQSSAGGSRVRVSSSSTAANQAGLSTYAGLAATESGLQLSRRATSARVLERMVDVAAWTVSSGAGVTITAGAGDLEHPRTALVDVPAGVTYGEVKRDLLCSLQGKALAFDVKVGANFSRIALALSLGDRTFNNRLETNVVQTGDYVVGKWHRIVVPMSRFALTYAGGFTAANVHAVRIQVYPTTAAATTAEIGPLTVHESPKSPGVCVIFDDGNSAVYNTAFPWMAQNGIVGNVAVAKNLVGTSGTYSYSSLPQLQEMYAAGWGMLNHSVAHNGMAGMTASQVQTEIYGCTNYLLANGMPSDARHFVYPGGSWDTTVLTEMERRVISSRIAGSQAPIWPDIGNMHLLRPWYITQSVTLANAKAAVDAVKDRGGLLYLTFHDLLPAVDARTETWPIADFQALMTYIAEQGVNTYRPSDLWGS